MAGRSDEVTITCVEIEIIEAFEGGERIGHDLAHWSLGLGKNFVEQSKPTYTFETFEKGGWENIDVVAIRKML